MGNSSLGNSHGHMVFLSHSDDVMKGAYFGLTTDAGVKPDDPGVGLFGCDVTNESARIMMKPGSIWRGAVMVGVQELIETCAKLLIHAGDGKPPQTLHLVFPDVTAAIAKDFMVQQTDWVSMSNERKR